MSQGGVETGAMNGREQKEEEEACHASGVLLEVNMPLLVDEGKGAAVDTDECETSDDGVDTEGVVVSSSTHELLPTLCLQRCAVGISTLMLLSSQLSAVSCCKARRPAAP